MNHIIVIISVSGMGVKNGDQEWGFLQDVQGEISRTGSSLMS